MPIITIGKTVMKKALCFIFMYFGLLIVGTALGSLVYSLYMNVINFTAGRPLELFKTTDLIKSFFYVNSCYAFSLANFASDSSFFASEFAF